MIETLTLPEKFSQLVRPRPDWIEIQSVERGLLRVLRKFDVLGLEFDGLQSCIDVCASGNLAQVVRVESVGSLGVRGLKTEYPQHAALVELGARDEVSDQLAELSALVMHTIERWDQRIAENSQEHASVEVLNRRAVAMWRIVRRISNAGILRLPPITRNIEQLYNNLDDMLEGMDPRERESLGQDFSYLDEIRRFFNFYLGGGRIYERSKSDPRESLKIEAHEVVVCSNQFDPDSELVAQAANDSLLVSRRDSSQLHQSEHYLAGNAPDELEDGPRLIRSRQPMATHYGGSPVQAAIRLNHRKAHLRRSAQLLPTRWNVLNDAEIRYVLRALLRENRRCSGVIRAALVLSLITGRDIDAVLAASVVRHSGQLPQIISSTDHLYIVEKSRSWATKILRPDARRKLRREWRSVLNDHESMISLPIPEPLWQVLAPRVCERAQHARSRSVRLFPDIDVQKVHELIRSFLVDLNREHKYRFTAARVSHQLTHDIHFLSGDLTEALLLTGKQPPYGASASVYYHHCDRQRLVDHYLHVTRRWMRLTGPGALCLPPRQGELIDGAVGSDLVLTTPVLIKLFAALRGQVKNDRMLLGTSDGLRHFHNSLTNYVLMMAYWLTGYRAVRDPLGAITEYNRERRLLLIADKTGDGYGHARVVPVCSLLAEQLDLYEKHIQWIRNRLSLANRGCRGVPMFFLDNEFNEVQVRPASMEAMLEWAYVLPLNLNRHWLRGELRRLEVPGPQVDRYMGHWSIGQEPWGRYSGVDPLDFSQALEPALEQLAAMLKLEIVRGVA